MCGIVGFIGAPRPDVLAAMTDSLIHRGPDGEGRHIEEAVGLHLGQRRLAILDIAGGAQPMWDVERRCVLIFNGQIYNHAELRRELEALGRPFHSDHSDTEVILQAYLAWGIEGMHHRFNGMWAFALYDVERKRLLLSRDRFGEKPLYYTDQNGIFAFASEVTALARHPQIDLGPSALSIQKYFAYGFVPGAASIYDRIGKLPAGCWMTVDLPTGARELRPYWSFQLRAGPGRQGRGCRRLCRGIARAHEARGRHAPCRRRAGRRALERRHQFLRRYAFRRRLDRPAGQDLLDRVRRAELR